MPLMPKRVKYRKQQKGRLTGISSRGNDLYYGEYGLKMIDPGAVTNIQIEAARVAITHTLKNHGKLWIRVFPDKAVTRHPAESRMGKGKGEVVHYAAIVLPGRILFEIGGVEQAVAAKALRLASYKFPYKTRIIMRHMQ